MDRPLEVRRTRPRAAAAELVATPPPLPSSPSADVEEPRARAGPRPGLVPAGVWSAEEGGSNGGPLEDLRRMASPLPAPTPFAAAVDADRPGAGTGGAATDAEPPSPTAALEVAMENDGSCEGSGCSGVVRPDDALDRAPGARGAAAAVAAAVLAVVAAAAGPTPAPTRLGRDLRPPAPFVVDAATPAVAVPTDGCPTRYGSRSLGRRPAMESTTHCQDTTGIPCSPACRMAM